MWSIDPAFGLFFVILAIALVRSLGEHANWNKGRRESAFFKHAIS